MSTQWSPMVYQSDHPPDHLYLTQEDVRNLISYWTRYQIKSSCFHNWKNLLGERVAGRRQSLYSNYLLAKFVRYAELMIRFGCEETAVNGFWNELDKCRRLVQQSSEAAGLSEIDQRQLLQREYIHDILAGRTSSEVNQTTSSARVRQPNESQIVTVPITATVV
jgi:hypothetical protein